MNSQVFERARKVIIVAAELNVQPEEINPETSLFAEEGVDVENCLWLDSLAMLSIVVELSKEFDMVIDDLPPESLVTMRALTDYLETLAQPVS